ncbi:hypothetical protein [Bacillus manliponensis]|uniref:hypothetical protein n=1 Tax=Bacillus manliponensis TaxID=574376 RepID=UPI000AD6BBCC|nr:hypothetical protein [Bacillus manliponensis]
MEHIISSNQNTLELYYALLRGVSLLTFKKLPAIENKKEAIKKEILREEDFYKL